MDTKKQFNRSFWELLHDTRVIQFRELPVLIQWLWLSSFNPQLTYRQNAERQSNHFRHCKRNRLKGKAIWCVCVCLWKNMWEAAHWQRGHLFKRHACVSPSRSPLKDGPKKRTPSAPAKLSYDTTWCWCLLAHAVRMHLALNVMTTKLPLSLYHT